MGGWSDLEVRARATSVVSSAVLYRAHAVLMRGRRVFGSGRIWVDGNDQDPVGRYVTSEANRAQIAHIASGWKQDASAAGGVLLGTHNLTRAYMGHKPWWWQGSYGGTTSTHGWGVLPNAVGGAAAIPFWRDVCASLCLREHGDEVELMEVDLRKGLHEGGSSNVAPSTCTCYAYDDLAKLNSSTAAHTPSQAAPNDIAIASFLSTASLVNHYVGTGAHDAGLHYRRFVNLYAVQRDEWKSLFVETQQSSVFYQRALEPGYTVDADSLDTDPNTYVRRQPNVRDLPACLRECVGGGDAERLAKRQDVATVVYDETAEHCWCSTTDFLALARDDALVHKPPENAPSVYRAQFCAGVAGGSSRSVVYRKQPNASLPRLPVCHGMPGAHRTQPRSLARAHAAFAFARQSARA